MSVCLYVKYVCMLDLLHYIRYHWADAISAFNHEGKNPEQQVSYKYISF